MPDIFQYRNPWRGLNISQPEHDIEPGATPYSVNFEYVLGELRTRRRFTVAASPNYPNGVLLKSIISFRDVGFLNKVIAIGSPKLYRFAAGVWAQIGADMTPTAGTADDFPLIPALYNGTVYYPYGDKLYSYNGTVFSNPASSFTGGKFISTLASHLIILNTTEGGANYYPQRVRWSASGLPLTLDPTVNTNAGYSDLDVADAISGFVNMGALGWILRTEGITQMIPTGSGIRPFDFLPLLSAPVGVGNYYPWSLDSFGLMCCFISRDDIYLGNPYGLTPIGGEAREAIFADIAQAGLPANYSPYTEPGYGGLRIPVIVGSIIAGTPFSTNKAGNINLHYIISIGGDGTARGGVYWQYDIRNKTWLRWTSQYGGLVSNIRKIQFDDNTYKLWASTYYTAPPA